MNLRTHTNAPTTIIDCPSPVNAAVSPTGTSQGKFGLTARSVATSADQPSFPYLAAMIQKANGFTSKKVVFDRSDYDDLLG